MNTVPLKSSERYRNLLNQHIIIIKDAEHFELSPKGGQVATFFWKRGREL